MAGLGAYGAAIASLAGGPKPPMGGPGPGGPMPPPPPMGSAMGMPPPSGIGAMPTGDTMTSPRDAASEAVNALTALKPHFPQMQHAIEAFVSQIQATAKAGGAPGGPVGPSSLTNGPPLMPGMGAPPPAPAPPMPGM